MTIRYRPVSRRTKFFSTGAFLLAAVLSIAVPTYFSFCELVYSHFGKTVDAKVTHRAEGWRGGGRGAPSRTVLNVGYSFQDGEGGAQSGRDVLPSGWDAQNGQPIMVEYVPGWAAMSRVKGNKPDLMKAWGIGGIVAAFSLGFGWLVWTVQTMANAPAKPNPVKQESPPVVWSEKDRRNTLIVCLVAALIIVVSLLIDRGVIGVMITLVILFALIALVGMDQLTKTIRRRTHSMWSLAQELTWDFAADGNEKLHQGLSRFHLATLGQSSTLTNLMYGRCDGTDVAVFDYAYTAGKHMASQTVVWMQRRGERMTEFSLRPESVWNQLGGWTAHGDINFDSHPEFSRSYLLRGDDEDAIRELFTDDVLSFYERHPNLITEGSGTKLLFYRDRIVVKPENLRTFLDEALAVRALFQPTH